MSLSAIVAALAEIEGADATLKDLGLVRAYPDLPKEKPQTPCLIHLPGHGKRAWPATSGLRSVDHHIETQLLLGRADMTAADALAKQFVEAMFDLIDSHVTLNGTCTMAGVTEYQAAGITWGGVSYAGIVFTVTVAERVPVVYAR